MPSDGSHPGDQGKSGCLHPDGEKGVTFRKGRGTDDRSGWRGRMKASFFIYQGRVLYNTHPGGTRKGNREGVCVRKRKKDHSGLEGVKKGGKS